MSGKKNDRKIIFWVVVIAIGFGYISHLAGCSPDDDGPSAIDIIDVRSGQ